ncbi:MAG: HIT family protein [Nanobdellota archaeon]
MECGICELAQGKAPELVIYEDEKAMAFLSEKPLAKGHVIVIPREHYETVEEIPQETLAHLYFVASFAATALFEMYGGGQTGTNIVVNEGKGSNRRFPHFSMDVIPRQQDDGINFRWELNSANSQELEEVLKKIKDQTFFIGKDTEERKPMEPQPPEEITEANYMVRQLDRIP